MSQTDTRIITIPKKPSYVKLSTLIVALAERDRTAFTLLNAAIDGVMSSWVAYNKANEHYLMCKKRASVKTLCRLMDKEGV